MNAPFYPERQFLYGSCFIDPEVPGYWNPRGHHRKPAPRQFPDHRTFDDGTAYQEFDSDSDGELIRFGGEMPSIINIETQIKKTLIVTIYGMTEEEDQTYELEIGKRYAIGFISETGFHTIDGYLRFISTSIPDDCTRYAGNYSSEILQAFIGMDCSTKGVSNKRKVYINTIRSITPLEDDEDYTPPAVAGTISDLLKMILDRVNYLDRCECKPVVDSIKNTVGEIKALQQYMQEHDEFTVDLDVNGDGVISMEELGFDENGNPIPVSGDEEVPNSETDPDGD